MNVKHLIAAVTVLAAGSAFADQTYPFVEFTNAQSSQNRAAAVEQAAPVATTAVAGKTRAQVMAELRQAQEQGTYVVGGEEFAGQHPTVAPGVQHSRLAKSN